MEMMTTTRRAMWFGLAAALSCGSVSLRAASDGFQASRHGPGRRGQRATERYRDPADAEARAGSRPTPASAAPRKARWACTSSRDRSCSTARSIRRSRKRSSTRSSAAGPAWSARVHRHRRQWHANNAAPPVIMGQQTHLVGRPNRYGLDVLRAARLGLPPERQGHVRRLEPGRLVRRLRSRADSRHRHRPPARPAVGRAFPRGHSSERSRSRGRHADADTRREGHRRPARRFHLRRRARHLERDDRSPAGGHRALRRRRGRGGGARLRPRAGPRDSRSAAAATTSPARRSATAA